MSGVYIGFDAFQEGILSKLNTAWPGFNLEIQKGVSNETDVVVDAVEGSASHEWVDISPMGTGKPQHSAEVPDTVGEFNPRLDPIQSIHTQH